MRIGERESRRGPPRRLKEWEKRRGKRPPTTAAEWRSWVQAETWREFGDFDMRTLTFTAPESVMKVAEELDPDRAGAFELSLADVEARTGYAEGTVRAALHRMRKHEQLRFTHGHMPRGTGPRDVYRGRITFLLWGNSKGPSKDDVAAAADMR